MLLKLIKLVVNMSSLVSYEAVQWMLDMCEFFRLQSLELCTPRNFIIDTLKQGLREEVQTTEGSVRLMTGLGLL